jgi:dihydrofolate reductase
MQRFDAFLFGRKSYEAVLAFGNNPFPGITNYVISNTLKNAKNFIVISGDVEKQVGDLKKQPGKDIAVWGGANLLASLLDLQLVDELTIAFIPVLLGKGKTMVDILKNNVWLSFNTSKVYENGTVELTYKVVYKAYNQSI